MPIATPPTSYSASKLAGSSTTKDCSFASIRFPVLSCKVKGGMRIHEHIYPHSPGAAVEKLGRDLYKIEIVPCFEANLIPDVYQGIWPARLSTIRGIFESGATEDLILPTIGKVRAMAVSWDQDFTPARSISGEAVTWSFIEDQENARLSDAVYAQSHNLKSSLDAFQVAGLSLDPKPSLWDQVTQAVDWALSFKGQGELWASLIESKLRGAITMIEEMLNQANALSDPRNAFAIEVIQELWAQVVAFYNDQRETGMRFKHIKTNRDMDIGQVAVWLYGDSEKASDLLSLNAFDDPYSIKTGTGIRYYEVVV